MYVIRSDYDTEFLRDLFIIYFNSIPRRFCGCVCASAIFCTHKHMMTLL